MNAILDRKMVQNPGLMLLVASIAILPFARISASYAQTHTIIELTDDDSRNSNPQINVDGYVVWEKSDGSDSEIFLYDGFTITQITEEDPFNHWSPRINDNGYVVWEGAKPMRPGWPSWNDIEIFLYDGLSTTRLTQNNYDDERPRINVNGYVVWQAKGPDGPDYEIFLYDGSTTIQITDNDCGDRYPEINASGHIVWEGVDRMTLDDWEIFLYDGSSTIQITDNNYDDWGPQINANGCVVWCAGADIVRYDGSTITKIAENVRPSYTGPKINDNGYVVWDDYVGTTSQIFLYDGSTITQITDDPIDCDEPQINANGHVVWTRHNPTEIFFYDGLTVTQISDIVNCDDLHPQINANGDIVWEARFDTHDYEVFFAKAVAPRFWAKTCGGSESDYAYSIQQTSDGGYILAGGTASYGAGSTDMWVMKLHPDGTIAWQKAYGTGVLEEALSVQQTADAGYIVAGQTTVFATGESDIWILKLTCDGTITWQKGYGLARIPEQVSCIRQTVDGGYVVAGCTHNPRSASTDILILKLNSDGSAAWQKSYGGSDDDCAYSIQQTADAGYIVAGGTSSFGAGSDDIWVMNLNSDGTVAWQKTYGGSDWDRAYSIQQTVDAGYIVTGQTSSFGAGNTDIWVLKLNSDGTVAWQKTYGGSDADAAYSIQQTADAGYALTGETWSFGTDPLRILRSGTTNSGDIWILKLNSDGSVTWQKTYGGNGADSALSIDQTLDTGYIVAGVTSSFGAPSANLWVSKIDAGGGISACTNMGITEAVVSDTFVEGSLTEASVRDTSLPVYDTSVFPNNTSAEMSTICPAAYGTTPPGDGIIVQPIDPGTLRVPLSVTFANVTMAGTTTATVSSSAPEPAPLGYKDGNPPTYYNVTTTAGFSGSVEVCIDYSAISFDNEQYLKLFQHLGGTWIDITSCVDTENDMICGSTDNLSILAIFEPSLAEALVDIDPDTLDLSSKGDWVTCYIELADGYKVMDIDGPWFEGVDVIRVVDEGQKE